MHIYYIHRRKLNQKSKREKNFKTHNQIIHRKPSLISWYMIYMIFPHLYGNILYIYIYTHIYIYINFQQHNSTHGHHQTVNTEIRLIVCFAAKDGDAL